MTTNEPNHRARPSLLEGIEESEPRRAHGEARATNARAPQLVARFGKPIGVALAVIGVAAGAVLAYQSFGPISTPNVMSDPLDDVLGFAMLDANFNRLPLEKRLELAREIAARLRSLSAQDSALMAAFAAGIAGKAREQLQDNFSTMMVDLMDAYAQKYAAARPDQKEAVLRQSLIELLALQQELDPTGMFGDDPPEQRLNEWKEGATERARRRAANAPTSITKSRAEEMLTRVEEDVNERTNPAERGRTVRFMRDTVRYLRGNDLETGKPKAPASNK